jgi:hypothetical protein
MNAANITLALDLLIRYTMAAQNLSLLINKARAEDRDISEEELVSLASADDTARDELNAAIIAAKARG